MKSILPDFSLFRRNKALAILFYGQWVSFMGTMMTGVALPFQIYKTTHSTAWVGAVGLVQLGPLLVAALWGGILADKYHRKPLLLLTGALAVLGSLGLVLNALTFHSLIFLFFIAALMSAVVGIDRPARSAFTQQLLAKEDFPAFSALSALKDNSSMIIGPAVGGLLIAHFSLALTYSIDCFSFIFALFTLCCVPAKANPRASEKTKFFASLKEGLSFAVSRPPLMGSYCVDFFAMLFGMPMALFPAIALHHFGAASLGWLYSAQAIGGLAFSMMSGAMSQIRRYGRAIAFSAGLWGLAILLFGLSHSLIWALFFLALAGAFDAASGLFRQTLWNEAVPNHLRGRLAGLEMISYMSGPRLGDAEAGLVASVWGIPVAIVSGGILTVISVIGCCWIWPEFTRYGSIDPELELTAKE